MADGQIDGQEKGEEAEKKPEAEDSEVKAEGDGQNKQIEDKKEEQKVTYPTHVLFIVSYIQDYIQSPQTKLDIDNIFTVPDESFEADLDENFSQAYTVIKKIKKYYRTIYKPPENETDQTEKSSTQKVLDLTRDNFLQRPGHKDDERNQDAYDDDYGADDYGPDSDDDLDLFGVDKKEEEAKQAEQEAKDEETPKEEAASQEPKEAAPADGQAEESQSQPPGAATQQAEQQQEEGEAD